MKGPSSTSKGTADSASSKPADKSRARVMLLNVGGTVMAFPRGQLLRRGLRDTCLAVLLHRFEEWMVTDTNGIHFIDADPKYFNWLDMKLLLGSRAICDGGRRASAFYHDRFLLSKTALTIDAQPGDSESGAFRDFMAIMGPFISSSFGGTGGTEVLSVCVDGEAVATTDATLADFQTLYDRFTKYTGPVVDVSMTLLHKIVDYVRRIRLAPDAVTPLPTCGSPGDLLYVCEMYGLMEQVYLSMIGKSHSHIKCVFKSSRDGWQYGALIARVAVAGVYGLLFVIEDEHHHTLACHIDGPFKPPADPTSELRTGCPVTFYSISGAFLEGITKINIPHDWQCVRVSGTEGAVKTGSIPCGKAAIGGGRLWLGQKDGRPTSDLRHCHQWLRRDDLPDGGETYMGSYDEAGRATLASSQAFTATRLEVYQVWSTRPADPILSADDLQALIDMATDTPMTSQLLYKGERDGWTYEALFAKVGGAVDLLLVFKDTGAHTFASHIKGQLKPPDDPTAVETTPCPVTFYSISGAFEQQGITKITVPHHYQRVKVAGIGGAVTEILGPLCCKVAIGARLWLGFGKGGPAGDLRSGCQWLSREELPRRMTYRGSFSEEGYATLAASHVFTGADLEIHALQQVSGAST
ncbi:unnamed protein product [Vitrella brassicaformis CCMP3155]|uniref:Potassium channel tetramerisation-type BTB domain-containing protein n=3 Tax=Vitrella brassicaformis TaxID=1169539 RepID=A0A0G4G7U5_VITBC|nr:unnamed protein product [Vitrella brassicaformis CCMP3155]|eukprot:CEM24729.1 unnamed protein product [Vitrella brassicaformis CCMP3155]